MKRIFKGPWFWIVLAVVGVLLALQFLAPNGGWDEIETSEMEDYITSGQVDDYFGAETSAAYRWMKPDARPSSTVLRLMHFMNSALLMQDAAGRSQMLEDWRKTVDQEARARGVDDVFKSGRWNTTTILDNGAPSSPIPLKKRSLPE